MRLIHRSQCKRVSLLARMWYRVCFSTSDDSRRMCLLASLYARLLDLEPNATSKAQMVELNDKLGLSRDPGVLRFPALLGRYIWKQVLPIQKHHDACVEHTIVRLLRKSPAWLWYGDMESRQEDIRCVIELARAKKC